MCFSETASWTAFAVGLSGQVACFLSGKPGSAVRRPLAFGLGSVVVMQLYEALFHRAKDGKPPLVCSPGVPCAERAAMLTSFLVPVVVAASIVHANGLTGRTDWHRSAFVLVSLAYGAVVLRRVWLDWDVPAITPASNPCRQGTSCTIRWTWTELERREVLVTMLLYCGVIVIPALALRPRESMWTFVGTVLGSLALANALPRPNKGSLWCFMAVVMPWLVYLLPWHSHRGPRAA